MRPARVVVLAVIVAATMPARADEVYRYRGPHPVPVEHGEFCQLRVRHFHSYRPAEPKVFRHEDGEYVFVGDPTGHGYTGPRLTFYGHHPVPAAWGGRWCFLAGPHSHFYRPVGAQFRFHGGTYYYAGPLTDPWYVAHRATYEPVLASYYLGRPGYVRPALYAAPPRVYLGPRVAVPIVRYVPPVVHVHGPAVHVGGPGVHVVTPAVVATEVKIKGGKHKVKMKHGGAVVLVPEDRVYFKVKGGKHGKYKVKLK
jgi:hypothetical protein